MIEIEPAEYALSGREVESFIAQYIETALWSEIDGEEGVPLDADYDADDVSAELRAEVVEDCENFLQSYEDLVNAAIGRPGYDLTNVAHDFLLTRNGHGAGFWDRGMGELGDLLTIAAKSFGGTCWYVGDDGKIYGA